MQWCQNEGTSLLRLSSNQFMCTDAHIHAHTHTHIHTHTHTHRLTHTRQYWQPMELNHMYSFSMTTCSGQTLTMMIVYQMRNCHRQAKNTTTRVLSPFIDVLPLNFFAWIFVDSTIFCCRWDLVLETSVILSCLMRMSQIASTTVTSTLLQVHTAYQYHKQSNFIGYLVPHVFHPNLHKTYIHPIILTSKCMDSDLL